jgi:hypothetical protein
MFLSHHCADGKEEPHDSVATSSGFEGRPIQKKVTVKNSETREDIKANLPHDKHDQRRNADLEKMRLDRNQNRRVPGIKN